MDAETIRQRLDGNGVKFTPQRHCVMAFLMESAGHPTAAEIFDGVNRLDPRSSRATVYRNLKDLVDAGLVRDGGGYGLVRCAAACSGVGGGAGCAGV